VPPYVRHDLDHANPKDRPTNEAYDRFVFIAARYRDSGYDDDQLLDQVPFLVAGPMFNAIHLWSTHALAEIAEIVGQDPVPHREAAARIHAGLLSELWDPEARRFCALDVVRGERSVEDTIVSLAPLLDPDLPKPQLDSIVGDLRSASFHPDRPNAYVVPSFDVLGTGFDERRYWQGPVWINTNWLLWMGLRQHGEDVLADEVLRSSLRLVERSGFHEYFDPFDGTAFGTDGFGWTAALTLDVIERYRGSDPERLLALLGDDPVATG
jgi:glycogen debranching enzyme